MRFGTNCRTIRLAYENIFVYYTSDRCSFALAYECFTPLAVAQCTCGAVFAQNQLSAKTNMASLKYTRPLRGYFMDGKTAQSFMNATATAFEKFRPLLDFRRKRGKY